MICRSTIFSFSAAVLVAAGGFLPARAADTASAAAGVTPLSADEIVHRAVERIESPDYQATHPDYEYRKHTVTEEVSPNGVLKEHREKLYDIHVQGGTSFPTLVQMNGRNVPEAELRRLQEKDAAERARVLDGQPGQKGDNRENFLNADLVSRYKFTLKGQETIKNRMAYVLEFEPRGPNLPIKHLTDRFANHMAGTVWIDAQEFEIAKATVHLQGEITLWGGLIGTLRRCDFTLVRARTEDGIWFNSFSHGMFEGRKLLEPLTIRTLSESSNIRRLALAKN